MLLDRLESGFLLFETPQGLVRAEPSLWQRIRLLWTFRHFRQLSIPLLNERERALVHALFQHNVGVVSFRDHGLPVIGIVENFVPPPLQIETQPGLLTESSTAAPSPSVFTPVVEGIRHEQKDERTLWAKAADLRDLASARLTSTRVALQKFVRCSLVAFKLATPTLSTIAAVLSIVMIASVALRRVLATPALQAHNPASVQSYTANLPSASLVVAKPAAIAESRATLSTPTVPVRSTVEQGAVPPVEAAPALSLHNSATGHSSQHEQRAGGVGLRPAGPGQSPVTTRLRVRRGDSTPNRPVASQESGIQATRPPLHFVYPAYQDDNVRGKVALTARVEADGKVSSVRVVSGNRVLSAAAVRAVRHWRYRPYIKDGEAVVTETNIVVSFFAEDAISMTYPTSLPSTE